MLQENTKAAVELEIFMITSVISGLKLLPTKECVGIVYFIYILRLLKLLIISGY